MIITKTPFRMSFFGGGTDIPDFFNRHKGAIISTSFDKYVYVTVRHLPRFFQYTTEVSYSKLERVNKVGDLEHPMVRNAMKYMKMHELHISYDADLPARSGLGSSSAFAVGLLNAFYCLKGKHVSKKQLADDAIYVERVLCEESGGWQDQIAASFGGFNRIDFKDNAYKVTPIIIKEKRKSELNSRLLLFFTGFTRFSSDLQKSLKTTIEEKEWEFFQLLKLVDEAQDILENDNRDLDDFGKLLDKTWSFKKMSGSHITNSEIDIFYEKAIKAGALGGKLLGAGGGGFLLFYVPSDKQDLVRKELNLLEVPFKFENDGTSVIYYSAEVYDESNNMEDFAE